MTILFSDVGGSVSTDANMAHALIQRWFDPHDLVVISGKRPEKIKGLNVISQCESALEMLYDLTPEIMNGLSKEMDLYINIGTPKEIPSTPAKRVREIDLSRSIGIVADFDVKPGAFASSSDLDEFINNLPIQPSIIVESGSGGLHAWWKISNLPKNQMSVGLARDMAEQWWSYLHYTAIDTYGASVDKIYDTARMLRLPGSIHWPRPGKIDAVPTPVILRTASGPDTTYQEILKHSAPTWEKHLNNRKRVQSADRDLYKTTIDYASLVGGGVWADRLIIAGLEEWFCEELTWEDILTPAGWTYVREDGLGRKEWARPGRDEKSATVDWPESPYVMSLLSTSYETGLLDLLDAGVPLTKFRVSLRLNFGDDYKSMVNWCLARMRGTMKSST